MKSWQYVSLPAWQIGLNVEVIVIFEFINPEIRITVKQIGVELILISEITNPKIRITSTLRYFCQTDRLQGFHFQKPLMYFLYYTG